MFAMRIALIRIGSTQDYDQAFKNIEFCIFAKSAGDLHREFGGFLKCSVVRGGISLYFGIKSTNGFAEMFDDGLQ